MSTCADCGEPAVYLAHLQHGHGPFGAEAAASVPLCAECAAIAEDTAATGQTRGLWLQPIYSA